MVFKSIVIILIFLTFLLSNSLGQSDFLFPVEAFGEKSLPLPQIFVYEDPTVVNSLEFYLSDEDEEYGTLARSIGRLDLTFRREGGSAFKVSCTASLVSRKYILTSSHCLSSPRLGGNLSEINLTLGYLPNDSIVRSFKVDKQPVEINRELGYSLLKVSDFPGYWYGFIHFTPRQPIEGERLFVISYSPKKSSLVTKDCQLFRQEETRLLHTCATVEGSSGGILFAESDNAILGLHWGEILTSSTESVGVSTKSMLIYEELRTRLNLSYLEGYFTDLVSQNNFLGKEFWKRYFLQTWQNPNYDPYNQDSGEFVMVY